MSKDDTQPQLNRRQLLSSTAAVAAVGAVTAGGALTFTGGAATPAKAATSAGLAYEVKPGELDEYYTFFSSGQSGEVRIVGLPSMREFMRTHMTQATAASVRAPYFLAYYYADDTHQDPTASVAAMRAFFAALGTPPALRRERAFANATHAVGSPWRSEAADEVLRETLAFLTQVLPHG